ncbi:hypothetical protein B0H16DRAFT_1684446 [Mycena metata]|uniref:Uncharacterized protein n=1 Tax=Mycena metata TaxID=1033252 RepID=A0AAD7K077_9AGAR|nr:hypothetical protein B0H16DRAFT_1684446 [Mycena metata]
MFCSAPTVSLRRSQAAHTTQMVLSRRPVQDFLDVPNVVTAFNAAGPQASSTPQTLSTSRKPSSLFNAAGLLNAASSHLNLGRTTTTLPSCGPAYGVYSATRGMKESVDNANTWYESELAMGTEGSENGPTWGMSPALTRSSKSCERFYEDTCTAEKRMDSKEWGRTGVEEAAHGGRSRNPTIVTDSESDCSDVAPGQIKRIVVNIGLTSGTSAVTWIHIGSPSTKAKVQSVRRLTLVSYKHVSSAYWTTVGKPRVPSRAPIPDKTSSGHNSVHRVQVSEEPGKRKRLKCEYVSITEQEERSENTSAEGNPAQSGMHTAPLHTMSPWTAGMPQNSNPPPTVFSASHIPPQGHSVPNPGQPASYNTHASHAASNSAHYSNTAYGGPAPQFMHAAQYPNYASPQPNHPSSAASGRHRYDMQTGHAAQYSSSRGRPSDYPSQHGSQVGVGDYSPNYNPDVTNADYGWNQSSPYGRWACADRGNSVWRAIDRLFVDLLSSTPGSVTEILPSIAEEDSLVVKRGQVESHWCTQISSLVISKYEKVRSSGNSVLDRSRRGCIIHKVEHVGSPRYSAVTLVACNDIEHCEHFHSIPVTGVPSRRSRTELLIHSYLAVATEMKLPPSGTGSEAFDMI